MGRRQGGVRAAVAVLLLGALAVAGCAGGEAGGEPPAARAGADPAADLRGAALQFSSCMCERGYDIPDPTFDDRGFPAFAEPGLRGNPQYEQARAECRKALDTAALAAGAPTKEEMQEQLLGFARCMRERGVNMPDPPAEGGLRLDGQLLSSPAWRPAAEACKSHLPAKYASLADGLDGGKPNGAPK